MRVAAVKATGRRNRYYVVRPDGSEASWAVASAPGLPHDLCHLVTESALGLRRAFWGMVADGMEPAHVRGVSDHVAATGHGGRADLYDLLTAEAAVDHLLGLAGTGADSAARVAGLAATLAALALPPLPVTVAAADAIRAEAARLAAEWDALAPGRALDLEFPLRS
jgi:hypothetical protein